MANYLSRHEATKLEAGVSLEILINSHDGGTWRPTQRCTEVIDTDTGAELSEKEKTALYPSANISMKHKTGLAYSRQKYYPL